MHVIIKLYKFNCNFKVCSNTINYRLKTFHKISWKKGVVNGLILFILKTTLVSTFIGIAAKLRFGANWYSKSETVSIKFGRLSGVENPGHLIPLPTYPRARSIKMTGFIQLFKFHMFFYVKNTHLK